MFENIKNKVIVHKNRIMLGAGTTATMLATTASTALASGTTSNDTAENLTSGMNGFIQLVTTMVNVILGSPTLAIAFAASFAFLAVRLIRKLKKG